MLRHDNLKCTVTPAIDVCKIVSKEVAADSPNDLASADEPRPEKRTAPFGPVAALRVRRFFGGEPTPLVSLGDVAHSWGLGGVYVKDESKRLGLQAFKAPGAAFAMATWMARDAGVDLDTVQGMEGLKACCAAKLGGKQITFVTCTDGNHGRAVSWAAKHLGQRAVVYMPKGSAQARVDHVRSHGGECTVTDLNYDKTVELASTMSKEHGWTLLQDTTLPGYQEIPTWIMQGYTGMADEAQEQIIAEGTDGPTHVFLQHGVGSLAGSMVGYFVERATRDGVPPPIFVTLEPKNAACAFASAQRGDGEAVGVDGDLETMIAGLACGVPSEIGWPILVENVRGGFCWMEDGLAGNGMRLLAKHGVEAGECGGAGIGLLQRLMDPSCERVAALRMQLGLNENSHVLLLNTEGATDPENYARQLELPDVPHSPTDFGFAPPLPAR